MNMMLNVLEILIALNLFFCYTGRLKGRKRKERTTPTDAIIPRVPRRRNHLPYTPTHRHLQEVSIRQPP